MIQSESQDDARICYFDNIRYLMVLLVVVLHVACGYSHYTVWWAVNDGNAVFFDYILRFLGVFLMPTLFFIAGYFALPSLNRKGARLFIKSKLIRLGLPWLIGVVLLGPVRNYIYEYSRGFEEANLWRLFVIYVADAVSLRTGFINSVYQFSHIHFWFISLLLLFFIVFALMHGGMRRPSETLASRRQPEDPAIKSVFLVLVLVSVMTAALTLLMFWLFTKGPGREPWVIVASVLQFQPTRVCLYGICFGLGIYTFHKNWFGSGKTPGNLIFWAALTLTIWIAKEAVLTSLLSRFTLTLGVIHETIRAFLVFSIIMTLVAFGGKYWQSASRINRSLAKNSYTIYLIHLIIVFLIQLLMFKWWDVSIYVKFATGSLLSLTVSYLCSEFMIRRYPRSSIAGMTGLFAVLTVIFR